MTKPITIEAVVNNSVENTWKFYTEPKHIVKWNAASPDWHSPKATNDVRVGGKFNIRMEAKDKSVGFDFEGTYTAVKQHEVLDYSLGDDRKVHITFTKHGNQTKVVIVFDAETQNSIDLQRAGWQSILDNFKAYTEKQK